MEIVKAIKCVNHCFFVESLEAKGEYIKKHNANILVMGDYWSGKFDHLNRLCEVIYLPRTPSISTTEIVEQYSLLEIKKMIC